MMLVGNRYGLAVLFLLAALGQASGLPALTRAQYIDQIQNYENRIAELASAPQNAVALRDSLPETLTVQTARGDMAVDLNFLRDALNRYLTSTAQVKPNILANAGSRLKAMRAEAELYEQPGRADNATRKRLDQILSAREFDRGPRADCARPAEAADSSVDRENAEEDQSQDS